MGPFAIFVPGECLGLISRAGEEERRPKGGGMRGEGSGTFPLFFAFGLPPEGPLLLLLLLLLLPLWSCAGENAAIKSSMLLVLVTDVFLCSSIGEDPLYGGGGTGLEDAGGGGMGLEGAGGGGTGLEGAGGGGMGLLEEIGLAGVALAGEVPATEIALK